MQQKKEATQCWWQKMRNQRDARQQRRTSAAPSINKSPRSLQINRLPIKVVIPINCDATLLQPGEQGENEPLRREGERGATLPCGCALPHIADAAFESLGGVPEGAHATVPVAFIRGLFGVSFWP